MATTRTITTEGKLIPIRFASDSLDLGEGVLNVVCGLRDANGVITKVPSENFTAIIEDEIGKEFGGISVGQALDVLGQWFDEQKAGE